MKNNYRAILFHPNGEYVTDFPSETKQKVWEKIDNKGSRWIFYPIPFVATDKSIVDVPDQLHHLKGKRIHTVQKYLQQRWAEYSQEICDSINAGDPLWSIY